MLFVRDPNGGISTSEFLLFFLIVKVPGVALGILERLEKKRNKKKSTVKKVDF